VPRILRLAPIAESEPNHLPISWTRNLTLFSEKTGAITGETLTADERERINARRALRSASWAAVFYLITTDILGPFNAPFALSQVGYVPGVILYFFMGIIACYTGLLLWYLFLKLDSDLYPVKTYADITRRIFGVEAAHVVNVLQSIQLIINVGTICLSNGQSLSQISKTHVSFLNLVTSALCRIPDIHNIRTLRVAPLEFVSSSESSDCLPWLRKFSLPVNHWSYHIISDDRNVSTSILISPSYTRNN
jgi:hypothetical protein